MGGVQVGSACAVQRRAAVAAAAGDPRRPAVASDWRAGRQHHAAGLSSELVTQREGMLHAVTHTRVALATQTLQLARRRTGNDAIRFLRVAVLEHASSLHNEAAAPAADLSDDALESDEGCRTVAPIHHEVLDVRVARDVAGIALGDARTRELRLARAFMVRLLVPTLDRESGIRLLFHAVRPPNAMI